MDVIGIIIIVMLTLILIGYYILFYNHTIYCMLFERKLVKRFNEITNLPDDEFSFDEETFRMIGSYCFDIKSYPDWHIWFCRETECAMVSNKKTHECIAGSFYRRGSNLLYKKMCMLMPSLICDFRAKYINTFRLMDYCEEDLKKSLTMINQNNLDSAK